MLRVGDRKAFLDANPDFFCLVVDYLNKQKYSPNINPENPCKVNYSFNSLWQILFSFGLEDYGVANSKEYICMPTIKKDQGWKRYSLDNITR